MKDKINKSEVRDLQYAQMEYPTWVLFKNLIVEAKQRNFPYVKLGSSPMACPNKTLIPVSGKPKLKSFLGSKVFVGIDVPVLLNPQKGRSGKTIVIVGESPLRDTKDKNPNDIFLGTPYAVHQEFGYPSHCNVYKKILSDLLAMGYSIYLTDIIKVWWQGKKGKEMKVNDIDRELWKKEIEMIKKGKYGIGKDVFIVAWGKTAKKELNKIAEYKNKFKPILHPGLMNWNNWKLHIFEKAIYEKKDINYAKKVYPNIGDSTTEVIVANEAVEEIFEYCSKTNIL